MLEKAGEAIAALRAPPCRFVGPGLSARAAAAKAKQDSLSDVLEKAGEAYRDQLKITAHAIDYLKGRGLSGQIAKRFGLGYAPEGWRSLASIFPKYDDPLLAESGLVIVNEEDDKRYDRSRLGQERVVVFGEDACQ